MQGGTNTLSLQGNNGLSFNGTIAVTNGVLQFTNGACLGATASPLYATNNGTLDLNSVPPGPKNIIIAGNGFNGQGAIVSTVSGDSGANGVLNLTLAGDASIGGTNRWDVWQNSFTGNGFKLTEIGPAPGSTIITDTGDTGLGDIHVVSGRLGFQGVVGMGDASKTCTVEPAGVLTFFATTNNAGAHQGQDKNLVLNGTGATLDSGGASNNFNGAITLIGTNIIGTRGPLHLWGNIGGGGALLLGNDSVGNSGQNLYLDGNNTYGGATIITNRTLFVGASSSIGTGSILLVSNGSNNVGRLDVTSQATFTVGSGRALSGNGVVAGSSLVFASGSTLSPGFGGSDISALTVNANLVLQTGSTTGITVNKTTSVANSKVNGLASVALGGTLALNSVGNALTGGDGLPLFGSSSYSGGFGAISPSTPGAGLAWSTNTLTTDGILRVVSTAQPTITASAVGNQLTLSWPGDHVGWLLQAKTNDIMGATWYDVANSASSSQAVITVDGANKAVFYRMILRQ